MCVLCCVCVGLLCVGVVMVGSLCSCCRVAMYWFVCIVLPCFMVVVLYGVWLFYCVCGVCCYDVIGK